MINPPKITIITPSFNQGHFIEQTILSVLNQNYPNLEYIIIDGGSSDNSVKIIEKYSSQLAYWVSEKDNGQSEAINKGLKLGTGDIINWLNSDDYYEPGALLKVAEAFREPGTMMVGGRSYLFTGERNIVRQSQGTDVYPGNLAKTIGWARIDQPETFFSKEAVAAMGLLDTRLHYLMDRDWWIKFLFQFGIDRVKQIPDLLVNFRLHEDSKTVSQSRQFQIEHDTYFYSLARTAGLHDYADLIKENTEVREGFAPDFQPADIELVKRAVNYYLLLRADEFYVGRDRKRVLSLLSGINKALLEETDRRHWKKVYYRSKLVPTQLLNLLRK